MVVVQLPAIAIPIGDPAGIGPEVVLKALASPAGVEHAAQVTVIGSREVLRQTFRELQAIYSAQTKDSVRSQLAVADPETLSILDPELGWDTHIQPGQPSKLTGAASFAYLQRAIAGCLAGEFQGIVTGPIAKSTWKAAGHDFPGQTELLATAAQVQQFGMMFVAQSPHTGWTLRALLATTHIPLRQVPEALTPELLTRKLRLLVQTLQQDFQIAQPKIAIAGLNPHSGEQGQLGQEELEWLNHWLEQQQVAYPQVQLYGPVPPDTLWVGAGRAWFGSGGSDTYVPPIYDAYLALYHDQGLIPVKLMAFDRAVNTTIGLPFVRTSPDHGTAFDIAGQGIADATSMQAAIALAVSLIQQRTTTY